MATNELLLCEALLSLEKLNAEGALAEVKTILGWVLNTRQLIISLPEKKHHEWTQDIMNLINSNLAQAKELEVNLG